MSTLESEKSETRTRILKATWDLIVERQGQGIRMQDIAAAAGISRQALYLHFASRAELLVATVQYGDTVRGLSERLREWRTATTGEELLNQYIEFWGCYIPEIYSIARALLAVRDTDEAAAIAWDERMAAVKSGCQRTVETLANEGRLAPEWTVAQAVDIFWTMLSIRNWEQLTQECGWSSDEYIARLQVLARRTLITAPE